MSKTQHIDESRFNFFIEKSGLRIAYIVDALGISYQNFRIKRHGELPFKKLEVDALVSMLEIPEEERDQIFLK